MDENRQVRLPPDAAAHLRMRFCVETQALDAMCHRSPVRLVELNVVGQIMELYVSARDSTCRRIAVLDPKDGRVHHVDLVPGAVEYP